MTREEYIKKYGEEAYNALPEETRKALEASSRTTVRQQTAQQKRKAITMTKEEYISRFGQENYDKLPDESKHLLESNSAKANSQSQAQTTSHEPEPERPHRPSEPQRFKPQSEAMKKNVINGVNFSAGERLLKKYHATHLTFPKSEGYIMVTNKRMIFRGEGGIINNFIMDEVNIDSVSGFSSFCGSSYIWWRIILGALMVLYGLLNVYGQSYNLLFGYSGGSSFSFTALAVLLLGGALIYFGHKYIFSFTVFSSQANGGPISIGEGTGSGGFVDSLFGKTSLYSVVGLPTEETSAMINEIGAVVRDLQTLDEETVFRKWS